MMKMEYKTDNQIFVFWYLKKRKKFIVHVKQNKIKETVANNKNGTESKQKKKSKESI